MSVLFMIKPKPLVLAIRTLISGSVLFNVAYAGDLPVPSANVTLSNTPVDIATQGHAAAAISGNAMTIRQTTDNAAIDWQKFNIGVENSVHFQQPATSSIALNTIHQADASKIMGTLTANGQVYLVNQNGFLFGKDSTINMNSLIATTLGISNDVFQKGITNAFNLNGGAALEGNGEIYLKESNGEPLKNAQGEPIKIQIFVEKGANIKTNAAGGRVILAAPSIDNEGTIQTPDGQAILAGAKDKVYLQEAGSDSSTRGLVVEVGTGGEVNNVGKVLAERGNASLLGFAVNQKGSVSATTSVRLNGSVRLVAHEGIQDPSGTGGKLLPQSTVRTEDLGDGLGTKATLHLSEGSRTSVDLDTNKTDAAIDAQAQIPSEVELSGHDVVLDSKAIVDAKSGNVAINAIDNPRDTQEKGDARIYLGADSRVDVSGVKNVQLPIERNVVQVELRKNELRDAPLQRDGILYGKTVAVDIRDAALTKDSSGKLTTATVPIADIKGAVDRIARNIDERSTSGGKITLKSTGDVVTQENSKLDVSGGSIAYQSGTIAMTQLSSADQLYSIAQADPNRLYSGISTLIYPASGYIEGKDGGQLMINTYEALLDGALHGDVVSGIFQRSPIEQAASSDLLLDLSNGNLFGKQAISFATKVEPTIISATESLPRNTDDMVNPIPLNLVANTFVKSGIANITIKTNDKVDILENSTVTLPKNGSLKITASSVDIQGSINAPSGHVAIEPISLDNVRLPNTITLGSQATIDVSGRLINDVLDNLNTKTLSELAIEGGSIALRTEQGDLTISEGSRLDVSGGAWLDSRGEVTAGQGGSLNLIAQTHDAGGQVANLLLDGNVSGLGIEQGGTLHLSNNEVLIGEKDNVTPQGNSPLLLNPDFFRKNGFATYDINSSVYGLSVSDNTKIQPQQQNTQLNASVQNQATGTSLRDITTPVTLPETLRHPVNVNLSFTELLNQNREQSLKIGLGASIETDKQATVQLSSDTSIFVDGAINTPAGNIALTITPPRSGDSGFFASQGIWLGAQSVLNAQGTFKPTLNAQNLTTGDVLSGGTVELTAGRGYIVTRASSLIDVSGANKTIAIPQGNTYINKNISSTGGTIQLSAGEGIIADGTLQSEGGKGAVGGSLSAELNSSLRNKPDLPISDSFFPDDENPEQLRTIQISTQTAPILDESIMQGDALDSALVSGKAFFNSDQLNTAKFASLAFKTDVVNLSGNYAGSVLFDGDVTLNAAKQIVFDTPQLQTRDGSIVLNTAYAALGSTQSRLDTDLGDGLFSSQLAPDAITGNGVFTVNAKNVDLIGGLSFDGFNNVNLSSLGDIRTQGIRVRYDSKDYLGEFKLEGDLNLSAAQVYPATLSRYTFNIKGDNSTLSLKNSGEVATPIYSAAGNLTLNAANIEQNGSIKAPFGILNLHALNQLHLGEGSITSVSGDGATVPFGRGSGGLNWLYPFDAQSTIALVVNTPPEKRLTLTGKEVNLDSGAKVDLKGGGELYAYEFIKGPGGSNDVLNSTQQFAILPSLGYGLTPFDPLELANSNLKVGDSVYLSDGADLKAGWYTLLPAHYALLPDAYLITPRANTTDLTANQTFTALNGATVVAGRLGDANAGIAKARWQGFAVQKGGEARKYSQYTDYFANQFFANKAEQSGVTASQLPNDAGSLVLAAQTKLSLSAELMAMPFGKGLGGLVDISADHLAIVGRRPEDVSDETDTVTLLVDDLDKLNAPSLLLGGVRSTNSAGQEVVAVNSQTLTIGGDVLLQGDEILLAAKDTLQISSGAQVKSVGKQQNTKSPSILLTSQVPALDSDGNALLDDNGSPLSALSGNSAFLRVSSSGQSEVVRDKNVTGASGVLIVESGSTLQSDNSMLLDSTKDTVFAGDIVMKGGALGLNASRISLGQAPQDTAGLVLASTQFSVDELTLNSRSNVDIYGEINVNTNALSIDSGGLRGFDNDGSEATITANSIILSNRNKAISDEDSTASGLLNLNAKTIQLGSGDYAINGFSQVNLNASNSLKGTGQIFAQKTGDSSLSAAGNLRVAGNVDVTAASVTGDTGSTTKIDAQGYHVNFNAVDTPSSSITQLGAHLGSAWTVRADAINSKAHFDLPSGSLTFAALQGDVALDAGNVIDVSGRNITFGNLSKYSPAGTVSLSSSNGNVVLLQEASLNLQGGGTLNISAPMGQFDWQGDINANASANTTQGSLSADVNSLDDFSVFNHKVVDAGFSESLTLEQRSGDLTIAPLDTLKAHQVSLAANSGRVLVDGVIDASSVKSGVVTLYGHDGITMGEQGKIIATNGHVTLDTVHRDDTQSGLLDLSQGGLIDVSGSEGGSVHLRIGRDDTQNTLNVSELNTQIKGVDTTGVMLEATRVYDNQSDINGDSIAAWQFDTANFMKTVPSFQNASTAAVQLVPGIEIRSNGDLTLSSKWDFMSHPYLAQTPGNENIDISAEPIANTEFPLTWRYGTENLPGFLTLYAEGDLWINASITDAFANTSLPNTDSRNVFHDTLQSGLSWSYQLIAKGGVKLANAYYPLDEYGEPAFDPSQVMVRTGTGDISIQSGSDITFVSDAQNSKAAAAIYTAGTPALYTKNQLLAGDIPGFPALGAQQSEADYLNSLDATQMNTLLRFGYFDENLIGLQYRVAEYPTHGGDINLNASGSINGINTGQEISDWLVRSGVIDQNNRPTAWGINVSSDEANTTDSGIHYFNQNIGTLGGGNVTVNAGKDVQNLSIMLPTTGKPFGELSLDVPNQWVKNNTIVNGGGDLTVHAGGDIIGGEYFVARGQGNIQAGGSVTKSADSNLGALLEVGDATINVNARQNVVIASVFNPTVLKQNVLLPNRIGDSRFFTYGENSAVELGATAGNIILQNDVTAIKAQKNRENDVEMGFEYAVYPQTLNATALSGDLRIYHSMTLFPSAKGNLSLLANNNIGVDDNAGQIIDVTMSDTDPSVLPSIASPAQQIEGSLNDNIINARERLSPRSPNATFIHATQPLHLNDDKKPVFMANLGNIAFPSNSQVTFFMPQSVDFSAGNDIQNLSLVAQQLASSDISHIKAGRDIVFDALINENGVIQSNDKTIEIGGAGELQVQAGRDISLGGSAGINTIGNTKNSVLSPKGASISLIAGSKQLVNKVTLDALFNTIKQSASTAAAAPNENRKALYQVGYDAIERVFPKSSSTGNLSLVFSQIKTLAGGDVYMSIPNGSVNVGLAGMVGGIQKGADQLGIVSQQSGDISAFVSGDFNVNQSRVFTMGGGDIAIWSSQGNIDAGKGAKSAISAPAPITSMDAMGNIVTIFPPVVSGSGIQTINPQDKAQKQGNVYLAAPAGIVDAGEAGISGGKIVIAANAVVGASNIQASGGSVGVPTAVSSPAVPSGASSAAASATKSASQMNEDSKNANTNDDNNTKNKQKTVMSLLSTDVIGYGDCSAAQVRDHKEGCGG
jgi:filamentous hemagglutinin family protein